MFNIFVPFVLIMYIRPNAVQVVLRRQLRVFQLVFPDVRTLLYNKAWESKVCLTFDDGMTSFHMLGAIYGELSKDCVLACSVLKVPSPCRIFELRRQNFVFSHSVLLPWIQTSLSYKPEIVFNWVKKTFTKKKKKKGQPFLLFFEAFSRDTDLWEGKMVLR